MTVMILPPDKAKEIARAKVAQWRKLGKRGLDRLLERMDRYRRGTGDDEEGLSIMTETLLFPSYMKLQQEFVGAIKRHDLEGVKAALERGAPIDGYFDGKTILMHACDRGSREIIGHLLERGADPNAMPCFSDMDGALLRAIGHGVDVVQLLIDFGADVNFSRNEHGWTALMGASDPGRIEKGRLLGVPGRMAEARLLLDNGADLEAREVLGWTALMVASRNGYPEIVYLLLSRGADANAVNRRGRSALMEACMGGDLPVTAQLLIGAGADIHLKDEEGKTALDFAIEKKHEGIAEVLRHHGAKDQG